MKTKLLITCLEKTTDLLEIITPTGATSVRFLTFSAVLVWRPGYGGGGGMSEN